MALEITITPKPRYRDEPPGAGEGGGDTSGGTGGGDAGRMVLLPDNDVTNIFLAELQMADTAATLSRLKSFTEDPTVGAAAGRTAGSLAKTAGTEPEKPDERPLLQRVVEGATAAAKDIGRGAYQAPSQIVGGAADAVKELTVTAEHMADWMQGVVPMKIPMPVAAVRAGMTATGAGALPGVLASDETIAGWMENPTKMIRDLMPDIDKRDTVTAHLVRDVTQFVTGMYLGARALGAFGIEAGGAGGMAATGAFADFATRSPDSGRLSDLIAGNPSLKNPVTEFLKSNPDDAEALKRFKNSLEGLGLGVLANGLVHGVGMVRAQLSALGGKKAVKALADDPLADARARYGEIEPTQIGLGDPGLPLVTTVKLSNGDKLTAGGRARAAIKATETGVPDQVTAKGMAGQAMVGEVGERGVYVNYARIEGPDDVKSAIDQVAEAFKGKIDKARRGVQTNEATRALADDLGLTVEDVLARRQGQPFNAEQALAARQLMNTTAERLVEAAKVAASPNATPAELFAFRKLLAVHTAVQTEVLAARTETARALQAWSIPAGTGNVEMSRHVQSMIEGTGGVFGTQQMAAALSQLSASGATRAGVNNFVRELGLQRSIEAIKTAWIAGLLSNPKTHIVNAASNTLVMMQQLYERKVAEGISALRGTEGGVAPGEAMAMVYGIKESARDAFRASWEAMKSGQTGAWAGKLEDTGTRAISAEAFNLGDSAVARTVDFMGKVFDVPGRLLGASDEFFKTIAYREELHAHAIRTAFSEGLQGEAAAARIADIMLHPPESIRLAAQDGALYATFTNKTGNIGQALLTMRQKAPATTIIMPFVRTPVNISRYAFERSPMAPLVGQWREDIAAGGARADLALARMATGTTIMMVALDLAEQGVITGNGPYTKNEGAKKGTDQRLGWQPYSVKVGDKYYSYQRADPFGMTMGFAADFADMVKRSEMEGDKMDDAEEVLAAGIAAIANATVSKTYLQGVSQFFAMMGDPTAASKSYVGRLAGSLVPAGVNAVTQAIDPTQRETMKLWDYVTARLPVLSQSLPPRLNLWGQVETDKSGLGEGTNVISPVQISQVKQQPIDIEMKRLNVGVDRIKQKVDWDGVPVNFADWPKVYETYVRLAGNDLVHPAWGLGARDYLNAVVGGKSPMSEVYRMGGEGEEGGKSIFIRQTVEQYRKLARAAIMADPRFQDFADTIRQGQDRKRQQRITLQ